jgi:DNA-binding LacI/PurR family transcriptional regulator
VRQHASIGVMSFYDSLTPWEKSPHLSRVFDGMNHRARELGYALEPRWLRAPGLTFRRFRGILETRGINGLLCFGSPDFEQEFPAELGGNAIVTLGLSIRTPLHRVTSHFYNDTVAALNRVHELGYRRPGLVLGAHEETRSAHAHSAAYLGWCDHALGPGAALPVLRVREVEEPAVTSWWVKNRPDVALFVHTPDMIGRFREFLNRLQIEVPGRLGVAVISHIVEGSGFSGMQQNQRLMGAWAVELLAARIANNDLGIPANPRIEMVESEWVEGKSLRSEG